MLGNLNKSDLVIDGMQPFSEFSVTDVIETHIRLFGLITLIRDRNELWQCVVA